MSWEPAFYAVQEEGLMVNVMTIVTRDFKPALDVLYPIEAALPETNPRFLRDFQERNLGMSPGLQFPSLSVGPLSNVSSPSDGLDRLTEDMQFEARIGVTDDSFDNVTIRLSRYIGTLNAVLYTARKKTKRDFFVNMSTQIFGFNLELRHVYEPFRDVNSQIFRSAWIGITIKVNEA